MITVSDEKALKNCYPVRCCFIRQLGSNIKTRKTKIKERRQLCTRCTAVPLHLDTYTYVRNRRDLTNYLIIIAWPIFSSYSVGLFLIQLQHLIDWNNEFDPWMASEKLDVNDFGSTSFRLFSDFYQPLRTE